VANAGTNITSVQQLIATAKSRPKELNYSSGGTGGITHLAMEIFLNKAGIDVTHVPYKGSGPAIVDLLAGQVQIAFSTPAAVMQHIKSGRLRALALASDSRSALAPDVPTFAEAGLPGVSVSTWYGLFGPANMAPELVERIARTVTTAARGTGVREKMMSDGYDAILTTPADFAQYIRVERDQWNAIARKINFQREK
jgi:tripartite-type tricarboxylate transporter receptor subunit TctC